jgi:hypothetical protein
MTPNHARSALVALACGAALMAVSPARADHHEAAAKAATATATDPGHDAMMAEMMKNAAPGSVHTELAGMVGTWKAKLKSWFAPGAPTESEGTVVHTMILGGRVLEGKFTGTFMGGPMTGVSLMGFDNAKQQYWSLWADDMSTSIMWETGGPAKEGVITLKGMADGPDGKPMECISTTKLVDADRHTYSMAAKMGDQLAPMLEITYTRAK